MIITCPHCQTKYQVTYEAIGSVGRKVQCANCQQAWQQEPLQRAEPTPEQKQMFEAIAEDGLDEAMAAEEREVAAEKAAATIKDKPQQKPPKKKPRTTSPKEQQQAFTRRRTAMEADLPLARLRRTLRVVAVLLLVGLVAVAYFGRVQVVQRFPAMAGIYDAVGLGVNVVGLEFSNVTTMHTKQNGNDVLIVSAQIVGLNAAPTHVPPVVVTLIDSHGQGLYEWSVTPVVRDLMAGERASFDTQLLLPPVDATRVRLSFAEGTVTGRPAGETMATSRPTTPAAGHILPGQEMTENAAPAAASEQSHTPEHH